MNPHSLAESVRQFLQERLPGIPVHTSLDNGELCLPYLLVQATADSELVPGKATWELTLALELHTSAPWCSFEAYSIRNAVASLNVRNVDFSWCSASFLVKWSRLRETAHKRKPC